jgi:type I restriction enzyme, S subunit
LRKWLSQRQGKEKAMNKPAEKGLVPELRFPEFQGVWHISTLGKIASISSGGTPSRAMPSYWKGDIPWVSTTLIDFNRINTVNESITELGLANSSAKVFPKNTILMAMYGQGKTRGKVAILDIQASINQACAAISLSRGMNIEFVFQNLASRYDEIRSISNQGGQENLSSGLIKEIPFSYPDVESSEQQKIADCLSSLDELVSAHTQKLDTLKAHKKGLMQQLFPAEGETVPKLRFPEFLGSDDWNKGCIDDLANLVMGNAFKSADFVCKGLQLIRMGNLYQGTLQLSRTPVYLPRSFEKEYSKFVVKPLDLLMSMTGTAGKEDYGYVVQVPKGSSYFMLNQRVVKVIPKKECVKEFLLQLLKSDNFLKSLYSLPGGTKQANLSAAQVKGLITMFPTPKEQQKIADCLSRLDELITAQKQKIESLKTHKKGLMQQLFPSAENGHMDAKAKVGA